MTDLNKDNEGYRKLHEFNLTNVTFFMCQEFDYCGSEISVEPITIHIAKNKVIWLKPLEKPYRYEICLENDERLTVACIGYL